MSILLHFGSAIGRNPGVVECVGHIQFAQATSHIFALVARKVALVALVALVSHQLTGYNKR